jgi:hypothetical protein
VLLKEVTLNENKIVLTKMEWIVLNSSYRKVRVKIKRNVVHWLKKAPVINERREF